MKHRLFGIAGIALALLAAGPAAAATEHAVFAGGCFWGVQAVFASLRGVTSTTAGFAGGAAATAHYEVVGTGMTGHAESVDVTYDPAKISFHQLLDVYFLVAHDPTELNRQGPDEGTQYRSEIFYTSEAQHQAAQSYIATLERHHVFSRPIVTKMEPYSGFYPAEGYHQNYLVHNPDSPYIVYNDIPKLKALVAKFPGLVNADAPAVRVAVKT
ncbi:MAG: peptide-methionine (S)-S-oxide reductase MsrA [Candidatus Baltobacteraceae bacterium]